MQALFDAKMIRRVVLIFVVLLSLNVFVTNVSAVAGEIDQSSIVLRVVDGDTFVLDSGERIRLADVNTPETNQAGYSEAKNFMIGLVEGKTVYIDIDDISRTDSYDRLVCVVYVDYNSTHYENVNKALLVGNYAVIYNFDNNEFSPSDWSLYVAKNAIPEFPTWAAILLVITLASLCALMFRKFSWQRVSR